MAQEALRAAVGSREDFPTAALQALQMAFPAAGFAMQEARRVEIVPLGISSSGGASEVCYWHAAHELYNGVAWRCMV